MTIPAAIFKRTNLKLCFIVSATLALVMSFRGFITSAISILFILGVAYERNSTQVIATNITALNKQWLMKTNGIAAGITLAYGFFFGIIGLFMFVELDMYKRFNDQSLAKKRKYLLYHLFILLFFDFVCFLLYVKGIVIYVPTFFGNPLSIVASDGVSLELYLRDVEIAAIQLLIVVVYALLLFAVLISHSYQMTLQKKEDEEAKPPEPILSTQQKLLMKEDELCGSRSQ